MSGAAYLGLILLVGGALLGRASRGYRRADDPGAANDVSLFRVLGEKRRFTRTSLLLQALGTVLLAIGILTMML